MAQGGISNEGIMWMTIAGLVSFSIFMFYILIKNPPWAGINIQSTGNTGAGPQPTSTM